MNEKIQELCWKAMEKAGLDIEACKEAEVDPVMACEVLRLDIDIDAIMSDDGVWDASEGLRPLTGEWKGTYHDPA